MNGRSLHVISVAVLLCIAGFFLACTQSNGLTGGSGSTTTNGFTATIVNREGEVVANAAVRVRPERYCASANGAATGVAGTVVDTFSGNDGTVTLGDLLPGKYVIEAFDASTGEGVVRLDTIDDGPAHDIGILTVERTGVISGVLEVDKLRLVPSFGIQVYGMERYAQVDSVTGNYLLSGMPAATYTLRLVSDDSTFVPLDLDTVTVSVADTVEVQSYTAWKYSADLTIHPLAAGLSAADTIMNFPLLLRLDRNNFDFSSERKKGGGFRVTKEDGTPVAFQQEWWDSANGTAALWLHVDTLFGDRQVQKLRLYWGNSAGSLLSEPEVVFDTGYGFTGVWHLNESGGKPQLDATVNGRSGIPEKMDGANDISGSIGRAQIFDDDSQCIVFDSAEVSGTNSVFGNGTSFTVSMWVKASGVPQSPQCLFSSDSGGFGILLDASSRWVVCGVGPESGSDSCFAPAVVETWVYLTAIRLNSWNYLYVNGEIADSGQVAGSTGTTADDTFRLGSFTDNSGWFTGAVDELRIYRQALPEHRLRVDYVTQREETQMLTIDQPQQQ